MKSFLRASASVLIVGLNSVAWLNATRSAVLLGKLTAVAATCSSGKFTVQSFGAEPFRFPFISTLLSFCMIASSLVKVHVQPASHSFPIDNRLVVPSAGNRSVCVASSGSCGRFRFAVCVDDMVDPSGSWTTVGDSVGFLLVHGTFRPLKWPVAPVSAMAVVAGGPKVVLSMRLRLLSATVLH